MWPELVLRRLFGSASLAAPLGDDSRIPGRRRSRLAIGGRSQKLASRHDMLLLRNLPAEEISAPRVAGRDVGNVASPSPKFRGCTKY